MAVWREDAAGGYSLGTARSGLFSWTREHVTRQSSATRRAYVIRYRVKSLPVDSLQSSYTYGMLVIICFNDKHIYKFSIQ